MKIAIRTDASTRLGSGHVMRCLALANALHGNGTEIVFVCREHEGDLRCLIEDCGFPVARLPAGAAPEGNSHASRLGANWETDADQTISALEKWGKPDWLIVDHYALDSGWESATRQRVNKIIVIDDMADRRHDCDILLDQNPHMDMLDRYDGLIPRECIQLLGPEYALLRPEFRKAREAQGQRDGTIRRIFVFFGGSDPGNETAKALEAVRHLEPTDLAIDVVVGNANPHREEIMQSCELLPGAAFHCQAVNMPELMAGADLAIGAGGITTWERCCLGLPSIVISIAPNQDSPSQYAGQIGVLRYLGKSAEISARDIAQAVTDMTGDRNRLLAMSAKGKNLVDGLGAIRVAQTMNFLSQDGIVLRHVFESDARNLFEWRNAPETRRYAFNPDCIAWEDHLLWLKNSLDNPDRCLLIGEQDHRPVGVLRYDLSGSMAEVSVYLVPGLHGRGLGSALIEAGNAWVRLNLPNITTLRARVMPENTASHKSFAKAGYLESNGIYEYPVCRQWI